MIQAITLDFWDTIYEDDQETDRIRKEKRLIMIYSFIMRSGYSHDINAIQSSIKESSKWAHNRWCIQMRTANAYERFQYICHKLNMTFPDTEVNLLIREVEDIGLIYPPKLIEGAAESIKILSQKYMLGIICDTGQTPGRILRRILEKDNLLEYFNTLTFSDEIGFSKPHKAMFQATLDSMNIDSNKVVHVGDNIHTDVKGALKYGMHAIHINPLKETTDEFVDFNFVSGLKNVPNLMEKIY